MAVQLTCRTIVSLGGAPPVRAGAITDIFTTIVDVRGLSFADPPTLESLINQLPGAVCTGTFARRRADICTPARASGVSCESL
jgi:ribose 5-phosphate isomerase A